MSTLKERFEKKFPDEAYAMNAQTDWGTPKEWFLDFIKSEIVLAQESCLIEEKGFIQEKPKRYMAMGWNSAREAQKEKNSEYIKSL